MICFGLIRNRPPASFPSASAYGFRPHSNARAGLLLAKPGPNQRPGPSTPSVTDHACSPSSRRRGSSSESTLWMRAWGQ